MVALTLVLVAFAYLLFVCASIGLHERLWLAFGPLSLERIPDVAARKHGDRVLFTSDEPCAWVVPQLAQPSADRSAWSAVRVRATAGYVAGLLRQRFDMQRDARVAILKENHLDMHLLMLGIIRGGGIACPMNGISWPRTWSPICSISAHGSCLPTHRPCVACSATAAASATSSTWC